MPILMSTPDMTAETWLGALACAPGSQTCSGMMPALSPKPHKPRTKMASRCGAASAGAQPSRSSVPEARARASANIANRHSVPTRVATR